MAGALLVVVTALINDDLVFSGKTLTSWDSSMHTWHAHMMATRHWPSLRGFTLEMLWGWPEGDDYALFIYLPALLVHKASLGLVDVERAMTWEVVLATVAWPLAFYVFFRREAGAWGALLGALLVLVDPGSWHQTGLLPLLVSACGPSVRASRSSS